VVVGTIFISGSILLARAAALDRIENFGAIIQHLVEFAN
jgi:hypothetical protein